MQKKCRLYCALQSATISLINSRSESTFSGNHAGRPKTDGGTMYKQILTDVELKT